MTAPLRQINTPIKKILIIGAECTGKSTLAHALADKYNTTYTPEYMRHYLEQKPDGYVCQWSDILPIAQGQIDSENDYVQRAKRYCFIDTSLILLNLYSHFYLGQSPDILEQSLSHQRYDLILLTDEIGIDWVADGMRDLPHGRTQMRQRIQDELHRHNLPYHIISGDLSNRLQQVDSLLKTLDD